MKLDEENAFASTDRRHCQEQFPLQSCSPPPLQILLNLVSLVAARLLQHLPVTLHHFLDNASQKILKPLDPALSSSRGFENSGLEGVTCS